MKNFYIAGASSRSRTARVYIEYLNPYMKISAFLVLPEIKDNELVVDGVSVVAIPVPRSHPSFGVSSDQNSQRPRQSNRDEA